MHPQFFSLKIYEWDFQMAYNATNDKLIKLFESDDEKTTIMASIMSYNGGEFKLQFQKRFPKSDGTVGYGKLGRLSLSEVEWLRDNLDGIIEKMKSE